MAVAYHRRGHDKTTAYVGVEFDIPATMLSFVKDLLSDVSADPELIELHELAREEAARFARELGIGVDAFDLYIEADEDWRTVAAKRDALRAGA